MQIGRVAGLVAVLLLTAATQPRSRTVRPRSSRRARGSCRSGCGSRWNSRPGCSRRCSGIFNWQRGRTPGFVIRSFAASQRRIAELATEIQRVQSEADRIQSRAIDGADAYAAAGANCQCTSDGERDARACRAGACADLHFRGRSPAGYLGVTLSGVQNTELRDGKVFTLYRVSHCRIESVEAGQPGGESGVASRRYDHCVRACDAARCRAAWRSPDAGRSPRDEGAPRWSRAGAECVGRHA